MSHMPTVPSAPPYMPTAIHRTHRGASAPTSFSIEIETTTPILGGAPTVRSIDEIDIIRIPTIRGHLRFWWRALQTGAHGSSEVLYQDEARLWGKAADESGAGRSLVEISVNSIRQGIVDRKTSAVEGRGAYALWPARPPQGRRRRGTEPVEGCSVRADFRCVFR